MSSDSIVDERTLREIYLTGFEIAVKEAAPKSIMSSYNRINGVYASENKWLLTDVLRDEWGFEGYVMSDWGAVNNRVKGIQAGCDLEMPSSNGYGTKKICDAVRNGSLDEKYLDIFNQLVEYTKDKFAVAPCGEWYGYLRRDGLPTEPSTKGSKAGTTSWE